MDAALSSSSQPPELSPTESLSVLAQVLLALRSTADLVTACSVAGTSAMRLLEASEYRLLSVDGRSGALRSLDESGVDAPYLADIGGVVEQVMRFETPVFDDGSGQAGRETALWTQPPAAVIATPLMAAGSVHGMLLVAFDVARSFSSLDRLAVLTIADALALTFEREEMRRLLREERLAITKLEQRLNEGEEASSSLMSVVAHEIRTPLTAIKAYTEAILENLTNPHAPRERFLTIINDECDRLSRLVSDVLDLSRVEAGQRPLRLAKLQLQSLIRETLESLQPVASTRKITFESDLDPDLSPEADPDLLKRLLINLLGNAVKFSPSGGRVRLQARARGEEWMCTVQDDGPGIPPEDLPRIFERFFRARQPGQQEVEGTGLGLAISRGIVELHGGRIWAQNLEPHGTRFCFSLPMRQLATTRARRVARLVWNRTDLRTLFDHTVEMVAAAMGAEIVSLMLVDPDHGDLFIASSRGLDSQSLTGRRTAMRSGVAGSVAAWGQAVLVNNIETDRRFRRLNHPQYRTKSLLCAPMRVQGEVIGVFNVNNKIDGTAFDADDLSVMRALIERVARCGRARRGAPRFAAPGARFDRGGADRHADEAPERARGTRRGPADAAAVYRSRADGFGVRSAGLRGEHSRPRYGTGRGPPRRGAARARTPSRNSSGTPRSARDPAAARVRGAGARDHSRPSRALGRQRLSARPGGRGDSARQPHSRGGGRVREHDARPALPAAAELEGSARRAAHRSRPAVRPAPGRGVRESGRARGAARMKRPRRKSESAARARRSRKALRREAAPSRSADPKRLIAELNADRERLNSLYILAVEQNRQRADKLHRILENISDINSGLDLDALLRRLAETIASTLGFRVVLIRLRDPGTDRLRAYAFSGIDAPSRAALEAQDVPLIEFLSWLREEFKVSQSYFISHAHDFSRKLPAGFTANHGPRQAGEWHPDDVLIVPLFDRTGEPVAYFSVDDPADRQVPSRETIELLEIFANHAVVAIENARLYRRVEAHSRELEDAGQRMSEVMTLKNNFVSTVSHELRTPLAAMSAYVDSLLGVREGQIEHEQLQSFLKVVSEESQRLTRLIESLLDLNRIDAGLTKMTRQSIDMRELIEETSRLLRPVAQIGQIALKESIDCADTRVDADRDQLRQLALHLGSNAIKFTPPGGSVTLRLFGDAREIGLQVEDTGIGIPEHALEKIFERFYQVDSSLERRFGGTGLGLAICKSIAEWHGGRVIAESEVGRGSRFTVVLPRRSERRVAVRPPTRSRAAVEDVLKLAVEIVAESMNAQVVSLMARDVDGSWTIRAAMGLDETVVRETRVPAGTGVVGWVGDRRRAVCEPDAGGTQPVQSSGRPQYNTATFLSVPVESSDELLGVLNVTEPEDGRLFRAEDWHLLVHLARRIAGVWEKARSVERMQVDIDGSTQALRQVLQHLQRSRRSAPNRVRLARALAREMRLAEDEVGLIGFAASLHDLGMNMVGEHVTEGGGRLDDEDRARIARHPEFAADTLELLGRIRVVEDVILSHHECWDGSGYPRGLSGDQIPIGARILAVVDAWESMTIGRAHRPARSSEDARLELVRLRGLQFDPDVVDAFDRALAEVRRTHEIDRRMELTDGRDAAPADNKTGR